MVDHLRAALGGQGGLGDNVHWVAARLSLLGSLGSLCCCVLGGLHCLQGGIAMPQSILLHRIKKVC